MKQAKFTAFLIAGLMASTLGLTSCGDDEDEVKPKAKSEMLTSAEWKGSYFIYEGDTLGDVDVRLKFNMNGKVESIDSGTTEIYDWKLINNDSQLIFDIDTMDVKTLTEKDLILGNKDEDGSDMEFQFVH